MRRLSRKVFRLTASVMFEELRVYAAGYDVMGPHYSMLRPKGSDEIVLSMPLASVLIAYEWRRMATRCRVRRTADRGARSA